MEEIENESEGLHSIGLSITNGSIEKCPNQLLLAGNVGTGKIKSSL